MFNPHPQIRRLAIDTNRHCLVVDDALLDPRAVVQAAARRQAQFVETAHNAYPGLELRLPDALHAQLEAWFAQHFRRLLCARRVLRSYSRLALVTWPPERLQPCQWFCHRDRIDPAPGVLNLASVLYLFDRPELGGTSFYRPRVGASEIERLLHDSAVLAPAEFGTRHGIAAGYQVDDNAWFERTLTVPARFNRLLLYDGAVFHGADLRAPGLLDCDPARGRLTWNGFYTCTGMAQ